MCKELSSRFFKYVKKTNSCWIWIGGKDKHGYGRFRVYDFVYHAHRFSFLLEYGNLNPKLVIDHLCNNTSCVNPKHLKETTIGKNTLRGNNCISRNSQKTHCINGHPLFGDNLLFTNNKRHCRICHNEQSKKYERMMAYL